MAVKTLFFEITVFAAVNFPKFPSLVRDDFSFSFRDRHFAEISKFL